MKLSEAIKILDDFKIKHGDIELCLVDADTGWIFTLNDNHFEYCKNNVFERIEISVNYGDETICIESSGI